MKFATKIFHVTVTLLFLLLRSIAITANSS